MIGILIQDGDIQVSAFALVLGNIDEQIAEGVIVANPGDFKETPKLGIGIYNYAGANTPDEFFKGNLKDQLKTQHLLPKSITISETEINVEL